MRNLPSSSVNDASEETQALTGGDPRPVRGEARTPAVGDLIGRYVVLGTLGAGGMGVVLAAYDPELDRKVALKVVRPDRAADRGEIERESRVIARLRHPNLVAVHDVGTTDLGVFLAMEFLEGVTLRAYQRTARSWRALVDVYVQAARGLAAVHDAGIVHGDFKPENVFVETVGDRVLVKLLDFGLAHAIEHEPVVTRPDGGSWIPAGTLAYMAPERVRGEVAAPRADQFSFAVALFEALAGHRPYTLEMLASTARGTADRVPVEWGDAAGAPAWLRAVALRGMSLDLDARWPTMHELATALERGPGRARRRLLATMGATVLGGGLAIGLSLPDPCADADATVRAAWSAETLGEARESISRVLDRDADGSAALDRMDRRITDYVDDLSTAARQNCRRTRSDDDLLEPRRLRCIDAGVATLEVWAEAFRSEDPEVVAAAFSDASGWTVQVSCGDDAMLLREPDPPAIAVDPVATRDYLRQIARASLLRFARDLGWSAGLLDALIAELRGFGDPLLLAEAQLARGVVASRAGAYKAGYEQLLEALGLAEAQGATRLQANIWRTIGDNRHQVAGAEDLENLALARATAASDRLGTPGALEAQIRISRAYAATRAGDYAAAEALLAEATALAEQADAPRQVVAAVMASVAVFLGTDRVDDALLAGERAESLAAVLYGDAHPESAIASGSYASALAAAGRLDESEARTRDALRRLDRWRVVSTQASGIACNWCHGVARMCRTPSIVEACTTCAQRALQSQEPAPSVIEGLAVAMSWLIATVPEAAVPIAQGVVDRALPPPGWSRVRGLAAVALMRSDPAAALRVASGACETDGVSSCGTDANYVVAMLEPDPRRRAASLAATLDDWGDAYIRQSRPWVGLLLAQTGKIDRQELAAARALTTTECHLGWAEVDAWLSGSGAAPPGGPPDNPKQPQR